MQRPKIAEGLRQFGITLNVIVMAIVLMAAGFAAPVRASTGPESEAPTGADAICTEATTEEDPVAKVTRFVTKPIAMVDTMLFGEAAATSQVCDGDPTKAGAERRASSESPAMLDLSRPGLLTVATAAFEDPEAGNPAPGIFFHRLEPMFYTGFAPRIQDPKRVHTFLGRGNQVRLTAVLSDEVLDEYLQDIALRYRGVQALLDAGELKLTQNKQWERFKNIVHAEGLLGLAEGANLMDPEAYRALSLVKMAALNPGRVFHIKMDLRERFAEWAEGALPASPTVSMSPDAELDAVNALLPTRFKHSTMTKTKAAKLEAARHAWADVHQGGDFETFFRAAAALFDEAGEGLYFVNDEGFLDVWEFTAIYPVGTLNQYVKHEGNQIPLYPCPGVRQICYHQRTRVADHISEKGSYGFTPWIPYMHVGSRLHNSFHSLWFRIDARHWDPLPEEWRRVSAGEREGKPYPYLWLVSRGPMSQGCTHVNAGFLNEFRQIFPSTEEGLSGVVTYRNKYQHYDVYDIDGNGEPEVMGVAYFHAYSLSNKKPFKYRANPNRKDFYAWLYGAGYRYDENDQVIFDEATVSKFRGARAVEGHTYHDIPLYEAEYFGESIQFYKTKPIDFIRELRRLSVSYAADETILGARMPKATGVMQADAKRAAPKEQAVR